MVWNSTLVKKCAFYDSFSFWMLLWHAADFTIDPYNITAFLIYYNACQVGLSTYIFVQLLRGGWGGAYSFLCQPVDYSASPQAMLMLHACHIYYLSKFSEFIDTFCFVARKQFDQVSLLNVVHHGIMPMSVWPGVRFLAGGHASFFGLLNSFVHIVMYFYYMMAALGPQYKNYLWWKEHLTALQMVQFVAIFVHGFQLVFYNDCNFPWQFGLYISAHALLFFALFSQFISRTTSKRLIKKQWSKTLALISKRIEMSTWKLHKSIFNIVLFQINVFL